MSVNVQTSDGLKPIAGYSKNDKLVHLILSYPDDVVGKVIYISNGMESYEVEAVEGGMIVDCKNLGQWLIEEPDNDILFSVDTTFYGNYEVEVEKKFKKWLKLGRVSREFSSLEEILADQTTLRQLMYIHASADYMLEWLQNDEAFRSALLASDNALKWIGLSDYAYDKLPSDFSAEWLAGPRWERALKDHVPVMTSNSAPYGTVFASNVASGTNAYNVFDNNQDSIWSNGRRADQGDDYIGYIFTNPICVKKLFIKVSGNASAGGGFIGKLQGSNDGNTWNDLCNIDVRSLDENYINSNDNNYYLRYRVLGRNKISSEWLGIFTIQFYGRSLNVSSNGVGTLPPQTEPKITIGGVTYWTNKSEREFEKGSTIKYLYDHGVELEDLLVGKGGASIVEKNEDNIYLYCVGGWNIAVVQATLDTTPYKLMRVVTGDKFLRHDYTVMRIGENAAVPIASKTFVSSEMPNSNFIDITSINGMMVPNIVANGDAVTYTSFKEWWLE